MKKNELLSILLLLIILLNNVTFVNTVSEYEISGFVTMKDSSPLNRVKVELLKGDKVIDSDSTDKKGFYRISKKIEDNSEYSLRVSDKKIQTMIISFDTTELEIVIDIIVNQYPSASIECPDKGYVNDLISFSASGSSDPDEDQLIYHWDFGDGSTSNDENPTHKYRNSGEHTVSLLVEDPNGASDYVQNTIEIINGPPTANANGPYTGYAGESIEFSSDGSHDPDGEIQSYLWEFEDGQQSEDPSPIITFQEIGVYSVSLTVFDDNGESDKDTSTVDIQATPPLPLIAECNGPYSGKTNTIIYFSSSGSSDPNGDSLEYYWSFGNGGNSFEINPSYVYSESGAYSVTLILTDQDLKTSTDTTTCYIRDPTPRPSPAPPPPNKKPVAVIESPSTGEVGINIQFSSNGSYDPEGGVITYSWDFGDGLISIKENPTHIYADAGTYEVILIVYDEEGKKDTYNTEITILNPNIPPIIILNNPSTGKTNESLQFTSDECFDPDGEIQNYAWDFGDNGTTYLDDPRHSYSSSGIYDVSLTVTDDRGTTTRAITPITINDNRSPIPIITCPDMTKVGQIVDFSANSSYDTDGGIIEYAWDFGDGSTSHLSEMQHVYLEEGEKTVILELTDNNQLKNETYALIKVSVNVPPEIQVNNSRIGIVFEEMLFNSESIDTDGEIVSTFWAFGDGETALGDTATHNYTTPGIYRGRITVTDDTLETSTEYIEIEINEPPRETIIPFYSIATTIIVSIAYLFRKPWLKFINRV